MTDYIVSNKSRVGSNSCAEYSLGMDVNKIAVFPITEDIIMVFHLITVLGNCHQGQPPTRNTVAGRSYEIVI